MIDDDLKKELLEYIEMEIARRLMTWRKNDNEKIEVIYNQFKRQWIPLVESVQLRMDKIESMINAYGVGVQNVYEQFSRLTDTNFIQNFDAQRVKYDKDFKQMQKDIQEIREYINKCYKKMSIINDMYSMRDNNPALVSKLCKIINIIKEEDDDF